MLLKGKQAAGDMQQQFQQGQQTTQPLGGMDDALNPPAGGSTDFDTGSSDTGATSGGVEELTPPPGFESEGSGDAAEDILDF